jgi:hypothetical protein
MAEHPLIATARKVRKEERNILMVSPLNARTLGSLTLSTKVLDYGDKRNPSRSTNIALFPLMGAVL